LTLSGDISTPTNLTQVISLHHSCLQTLLSRQ